MLILSSRRKLITGAASIAAFSLLDSKKASAALPTTWDPANKGVNVTLSPDKLTATVASGNGAVRSTNSQAGLKRYIEAVAVSRDAAGSWFMGFCNSTPVPAGVGFDGANSVGSQMTPGNNGVTFFSSASKGNDGIASTDVFIAMAVDLDASPVKYWTRHQSTVNWNNAGIGSADPAAGIGAYTLTGFTGPFFVSWAGTFSTVSDIVTVNFGASAFTLTPPVGFVSWDTGLALGGASAMLTGMGQ